LEESIRLNQTIDGLLLLSKAETAQADSQATPFSLVELVHEILSLLEVLIEERHITVTEENQTAVPKPLVADRSLIRVALLNVLHNAIKFSPDQCNLRIAYSVVDRHGIAFYCVSIHDSGPGILPGEYQRVFERFFISGVYQGSTYRGAGLGLSIAKLIIDRAGGRISFDENAAQGANCLIELPASI
jgi:signal transduction histidine kinase